MTTRSTKKHLYNVNDVVIDLDKNDKGINSYVFNCPSKAEAIMCRNNIQTVLAKNELTHNYKTKVLNSVDLEGVVYWFCMVTKV